MALPCMVACRPLEVYGPMSAVVTRVIMRTHYSMVYMSLMNSTYTMYATNVAHSNTPTLRNCAVTLYRWFMSFFGNDFFMCYSLLYTMSRHTSMVEAIMYSSIVTSIRHLLFSYATIVSSVT